MRRFQTHDEESEQHSMDLALLRRLWPFARPYRTAFGLCLLSLLVSFCLEAVRPYLLGLVIDGPIAQALRDDEVDYGVVWSLGTWFLLSTVLSVGIGYVYTWTTALNGQRVIRDVRTKVYRHLLQLSPRFFEHNPSGRLVTRVTTDVENLNELISTGVLQSIFDLLKVVGLFTVMFFIQWQLALLTFAAVPVLIVTSFVFRGWARRSFRKVRRDQAKLNGFTAEAIAGTTATRAFGQEETVQTHFDDLNTRTQRSWIQTVFHFALFFSIVDMVIHCTQVWLLYTGGSAILSGELTFGVFAQFWIYLSMITEPIKRLGEKYNVLQAAFASAERIFHILEQKIDPVAPADPRANGRGPATIESRDLHFEYKPGVPVLKGVSFAVAEGTVVAIVGPTGAGKSTILSMLSRLQDPDSGEILLDGIDVRELDLDGLRRRIAVVPQDVFLFAGSVLENVRLFDSTISEENVRQALAAVGALDFVLAREGGLEGKIEEGGATFSRGEQQLLSFARAVAADPDLLVLDEATASIDTDSEARIREGMAHLLQGRTCVVVAHRLSTVRDAAQILVMREGEIVERGTHQELLTASGTYAKMLSAAAAAES